MEINRKELIKALKIVKPGTTTPLERLLQASTFAFVKGRVVTYNDVISVSHPVEGLEIDGAIEADELYRYLNKVTQEIVDIGVTHDDKLNQTTLVMDSGKASAGFTIQKKIDLPLKNLDAKMKWEKLPERFMEYLKLAAGTCSKENSKPVLTCVHITSKGIIESSDGLRITWCDLKEKIPVKTFLIPIKAVKELIKLDVYKIADATNNWIHFKTKEGTVFSARIMHDKYVDTKPFLGLQGEEIIFPKSIVEILDRAVIFQRTEETVTVILKKKRIVIKSRSDSAWFKESARIRYNSDKQIEFHVTPSLIKHTLERSSTFMISDNFIQFIGDNEDWKFVAALRKFE